MTNDTTTNRQPTCEERIDAKLESELETLREAWEVYTGQRAPTDEDCTFVRHGLSFDYVAPETFDDQPEGYFRYQISWGGPSDEFRFYVNPDYSTHCIEYWFLDWFDGASRTLAGADARLLEEIFEDFRKCGTVEAAYRQAVEDA